MSAFNLNDIKYAIKDSLRTNAFENNTYEEGFNNFNDYDNCKTLDDIVVKAGRKKKECLVY